MARTHNTQYGNLEPTRRSPHAAPKAPSNLLIRLAWKTRKTNSRLWLRRGWMTWVAAPTIRPCWKSHERLKDCNPWRHLDKSSVSSWSFWRWASAVSAGNLTYLTHLNLLILISICSDRHDNRVGPPELVIHTDNYKSFPHDDAQCVRHSQ